EGEVHRHGPHAQTQQHQERCDEQRHLHARADRNREGGGHAVSHRARPTRGGATNSAPCPLEPIPIGRERSMRFRIAAVTAVACSAALPRIATTKTPTKASPRPSASAAGPIAPTRVSLIQAIATVAAASTLAARPTLQRAA